MGNHENPIKNSIKKVSFDFLSFLIFFAKIKGVKKRSIPFSLLSHFFGKWGCGGCEEPIIWSLSRNDCLDEIKRKAKCYFSTNNGHAANRTKIRFANSVQVVPKCSQRVHQVLK